MMIKQRPHYINTVVKVPAEKYSLPDLLFYIFPSYWYNIIITIEKEVIVISQVGLQLT